MKAFYKVIIELSFFVFLFALNLQAQSFKIVLSSNSLEPPGIYGTNSLNAGGFTFAYNSYYLNNVYYSSYPVYSRNSDVFVRFETNPQGTKLIVRKALNGDYFREFDITGYNPQWIGSSGKLYYEKAPAGSVTECRSIDIVSGVDEKIGELNDQYYPPSDPALGAGAVSYDGKKIAYLKGVSIYIYNISTGEENPLVKPDENNTVDDSLERKVKLVAGPAAPMTIRHLSWSKDGEFIACFGSVSFQRPLPSDTTKFYTLSRQGILVVKTSSGEVKTIYESKNYTFEHPENFFFSPSGKTLAFNVTGLNNKVHIFMANPKKSNSGRDRGIGRIIAGFPSKQYWALNPWSSDGGKLLYQNEDDGTLGYTRECSDGQIIMNKDVKKIYIQDAQWADVSASTKPYTITLVDINNIPIAEKLFYLYLNGCKLDSIMTDASGKFTLSAFKGDTLKVEHFPSYRSAVKPGHDSCAGDTMYYITIDNGKFDGVGNSFYFELGADKNPTIIVDHTTINYNLIVSIGWDAKREYIDTLASWCRKLSNYYYDVSDGQIKFNQIDIYDNLQKWNECDIRVFANNMVWPMSYAGAINNNDPDLIVNLPRKWYGDSSKSRNLSSRIDWLSIKNDYQAPTIGHELGHYMLGFYDEYLFFNSAGNPIDGRSLPAGYNFGFMQKQYPSGGVWSTEMSNASRYPNNNYKITKQWYKNRVDCWTGFEKNYEKVYNGVLCPIIKPSERVITGGLNYLPGPELNVGKELKINIYDKNTGAGDVNLIVFDRTRRPLRQSSIFLYKPTATIPEGDNADDGTFRVLGANVNDKLRLIDIDKTTNTTYEQIVNVTAVTSFEKEKERTLDEPVEVIMNEVSGTFNQVNTWNFDNNRNLNFKSYVNKQFSNQPSLEISNSVDSLINFDMNYASGKLLYSSLLDSNIKSSGIIMMNAYDDSQDTFFVPMTYKITGNNPILSNYEGDLNLFLDSANEQITKIAFLSCKFHTSRNGLDDDAEQSGNVHSIATYPIPVNSELPSAIQIGYYPDELVNKPQDWLRIFKWDEDSLKWSLLGGIVDTVNHYVRTTITSTGTYAVFTVNNPVSVDEGSLYYNIQITPNPCDDRAILSITNLKDEIVSISLFNSYGNEIAMLSENTYLSPGNHKLEINTGDLTSGIYFLRVRTRAGSHLVKFVVVR